MPVAEKFEQMGARCVEREMVDNSWRPWSRGPVSLDVRKDKDGEYFLLNHRADVQLETLQVDPKDRHLVLLVRDGREKSRFLCGHDERHWFVAAIPETARVTTVREAKEALKPPEVSGIKLKMKELNKRRNAGWLRQGEWFFIPVGCEMDSYLSEEGIVHKNEIFTRGGKPHVAAELVREGGHTVYVRDGTRTVTKTISQGEFDSLDRVERARYRAQTADMKMYVRGTIRHGDHATLTLDRWHSVALNTEQKARAMRHVAFLD